MQAEQPSRKTSRPTLPPSVRLRSRAQFDRILKSGRRASDSTLTVYTSDAEAAPAKLGIAASRRLGNAVARNRIKRLVREVFRRCRAGLPPATEWVVIPRRAAASYQEVDKSFQKLSQRLIQELNAK